MLSTPAIDKVFERTSVPLTLADARAGDYPLIRVNKSFCALSGYPQIDMLGRNCRFMQGDMRDQPGRHELAEALKAGSDAQVVLRNFTRLGDPFDNILFIHHVRDIEGRLLYILGSQFRIDDRRSATRLDAHIRDIEDGLEFMYPGQAQLEMTVRRQLSSSMAAMLDSAVLADRLRAHVERGSF